MKEFMLLFRADYSKMQFSSKEDWQSTAKKWKNWTEGLKSQNKWVSEGQQLSPSGKVVKAGGIITDGPYVEMKESLLSYCIIRAESEEEAAELSKNCPILDSDGSVEIREKINSSSKQ